MVKLACDSHGPMNELQNIVLNKKNVIQICNNNKEKKNTELKKYAIHN